MQQHATHSLLQGTALIDSVPLVHLQSPAEEMNIYSFALETKAKGRWWIRCGLLRSYDCCPWCGD